MRYYTQTVPSGRNGGAGLSREVNPVRRKASFRRLSPFFLTVTVMLQLALLIVPAAAVHADSGKTVVRVGWHEPPYFITDASGRKSGYSYEYQRKVAAYTGWEYEYVEDSWANLLQMLKEGKIDLLSDVSYLEVRTRDMLYTSIPMGTEAYYLFVSPDNTEITSENLSALNGKTVGVAKGSIQREYFLEWAANHGIEVTLTETSTIEQETLKRLGTDFDAFVTMDVYGSPDTAVPVCKIGSSDFYFAVSKNRLDLLTELDAALNRIQDENKYYDQQLHDKYLKSTETNRYFSHAESEWLAAHKTIRVGYQDNYLAFCAKDPATNELTGALNDYLHYASGAFENAELHFEPVCFSTAKEALDALQSGEIDCMFPANLTDYDAESLGLLLSPPFMHTEMDAVVRAAEQKEFVRQESVTVAVNEGNTNYELFLEEHYPGWQRAYFKDTPAALEAVADRKADCVIISNYRYSNISRQCEKLHLTTVHTGVNMDYSFAVCKGNTELYSILAKVTNVVPESAVHAALTYYSTEDVKVTFFELMREYLWIIMAAIAVILLIIIILLLRSTRAEKKARETENQVQVLNKRVFVDALTSVRNKGAYSEFIQKLQTQIDQGEQPDFAIGMFDCNDLKTINDQLGHDKGDIYLKNACTLICKVFSHSAVFRIGGDEFAAVLQNEDFHNRKALMQRFEERQQEICTAAKNKWDEVHIAVGIAVYDPQLDGSVSDTVRRADQIMYEHKRLTKSAVQ